MSWDTIQQLLRILLQLGAGVLVQRGLITEEMGVTLIGSLLAIGGIVWWAFWEKDRPTALERDTTL